MSIKNTQRLKKLQGMAATAEADLQSLEEQSKGTYRKRREVSEQLNNIRDEIKKLTIREPVISEHAIIRYLQRAKGLNLDDVKAEMLTLRTKEAIMTLGDGKYPIRNGIYLIVKNQTVVTVYSKKQQTNNS